MTSVLYITVVEEEDEPPYNPSLLDDPELQSGGFRTVLNSSYIVSTIPVSLMARATVCDDFHNLCLMQRYFFHVIEGILNKLCMKNISQQKHIHMQE